MDRHHGWALATGGGVLRTATSGHSGAPEAVLPIGHQRWWQAADTQLVFTTQRTGWALLTQGFGCASQMTYVPYATSDGGHHWTPRLVGPGACGGSHLPRGPFGPSGEPSGLAILGHNAAWLAAVSPASGLLGVAATVNGGRSWSQFPRAVRDLAGFAEAIDFVDPSTGWLVTGGENLPTVSGRILHTTDGWSLLEYPICSPIVAHEDASRYLHSTSGLLMTPYQPTRLRTSRDEVSRQSWHCSPTTASPCTSSIC